MRGEKYKDDKIKKKIIFIAKTSWESNENFVLKLYLVKQVSVLKQGFINKYST